MKLDAALDHFLASVRPDEPTLVRLWHEYNRGIAGTVPLFTQRWTAGDGIFARLAQRLGLVFQPEGINRVDAVFLDPIGRQPVWLLEHENKKPTAMGEVIKLAQIACPLRFVITYPWTKVLARMDDEADDFARQCGIALRSIMVQEGELIIAFGVLRVDSIEWKYFAWTGAAFDEIEA